MEESGNCIRDINEEIKLMINIETYIKKKNKIIISLENINEIYSLYFVRCDDESCLEYIEDFCYLDGVITISCDGMYILDFSYWDLVDQLWSYLIDAIYEISEGKKM